MPVQMHRLACWGRIPLGNRLFSRKNLLSAYNTSELFRPDETFIIEPGEQFGYRGRKSAEKLVQELTGLFAGGEMAEEDMDALMLAVQQAYVDAKKKNKKYTPKKYLDKQ